MEDISCNKFETFTVFYNIEHKKNRNGANLLVFHRSMSQVTRLEQKKWNKIDKYEKK